MEKEKKENKFLTYVKGLPKRWFITAFSGMAQGLFVTLIAGTILAQIAGWIGSSNYCGYLLIRIANVAKSLMGTGSSMEIVFTSSCSLSGVTTSPAVTGYHSEVHIARDS